MTVKMVRDADQYPAPHEADVHPGEVENYRAGGWVPAAPLDHDGGGVKGSSLPRRGRKPKAD